MLSRIGWRVARWLYALFFILTGVWILISLGAGMPRLPQPTPAAAAFDAAMGRTGFLDEMIALSYLAGGLSLLRERFAPLGLALLAPPIAVILGFHLFLTGLYAWGGGVAAYWCALAWKYRSGFAGLWTWRVPEGE